MILFYLCNSHGSLYKFIKSSFYLGDDLILFDILLTKYFVKVLDKLHGDDLVGELVIIFVDEATKTKVEFEWVAIFSWDKST